MRYFIAIIFTLLITDVYGKRDSVSSNSTFQIGLDYQKKIIYNSASQFNYNLGLATLVSDYNTWTSVGGYGLNLVYSKPKWGLEVDLNRSNTVVVFDVLTKENPFVAANDYSNNYKNYLKISQNCLNLSFLAKKQLLNVKKSTVSCHFGVNLCFRPYDAKIIEEDFYKVDSFGLRTKTGNTWQNGESVDIKYALNVNATQELTNQFKFGFEYLYQYNKKVQLFTQISALYGTAIVESMAISYNYETAMQPVSDLPNVLKVSNTNSGYLLILGTRYKLSKNR